MHTAFDPDGLICCHNCIHAEICQNLKAQLMLCDKWCVLDDTKREALEMICHKIARVLNGNPDYVDNWVDIAGYAQLVIRELQNVKPN